MTQKFTNKEMTDWQQLDDDILIKVFLQGDQSAFEVLFKKYQKQVARLVISIAKRESLVDDIVQEVFLLVYRHLHKFKGQSAFKTWIYRITVNETMRQLNKAKRWQPLPESGPDGLQSMPSLVVYDSGPTPERVLIDRQQKIVIREALSTLKPNHQVILTLYYLEDLPVQEIAQILDIPEGSVKSRLYYARDALKKALQSVLSTPERNLGGIHAL